jgi:hypothetical protein
MAIGWRLVACFSLEGFPLQEFFDSEQTEVDEVVLGFLHRVLHRFQPWHHVLCGCFGGIQPDPDVLLLPLHQGQEKVQRFGSVPPAHCRDQQSMSFVACSDRPTRSTPSSAPRHIN